MSTAVARPTHNIQGFFQTIYRYREYLKQSVARDLRKKYKRSLLGYCWSMLNPLFMMIILAVVFSNIMRAGVEAYAVFLFAGMLPYRFFSGTIVQSLDAISGNMNLINQVSVPKYLFPLAIGFSNLADFLLTLFPLLLVMLVMGTPFSWTIFLFPLVIIPLFCFTMGIALLFAVSNVFFNDTQHLSGVILQAVYFLCPILYGREHLPAWLVKWLVANPLFSIIEMNRSIFYYGLAPDPREYLIVCATSLLFLGLGLWVFKKADNKFIYFV